MSKNGGFVRAGLFILLLSAVTTARPQTRSIRIPNTTHAGIRTSRDLGHVSPDLPMERITLLLKSSPQQESDLELLLAGQQDPASPDYHHWLTPEEFGLRFGPAPQDMDAISSWLQSNGFRIDNIAAGRRQIEFSGTAGQVENLLHTEIHAYAADGETHFANATDIAIPEALAPVVQGVVSLNNFPLRSSKVRPEATAGDGSHQMSPYDFATIYDVTDLWNEQIDGTGQSIAIVASTNINLNDVATFRAMMGLPANPPQVILNGRDPGVANKNAEGEADLDVEWSGAVAKGATIKFVVSADTNSGAGVILSTNYAVNNKVAPVLSISFGSCEAASLGQAQSFGSLWQQAAAEGISVIVASGDSGSAGCDPDTSPLATHGMGVSGLASTPYNLAVGGTEFNDVGADATYWNVKNTPSLLSVKSYIPEVAWNESGPNGIFGGGGGVSTVFATPSWQVGVGVPTVDPGTASQHHRYLPDVSLSASLHDGYLIMQEGKLFPVSGTSASAPAFAGIMAMINQLTNQANGNPNPSLYALAASTPAIFHDVVNGTNAEPCASGSPNCTGGLLNGYAAGPGYDLATGWGSVDAHALVHAWTVATPVASLSITSTSPLAGGFVGTSYSQTLAAAGGTSPYTWGVAGGNLPPGLSLNAGVISGKPTASGIFNFNLQVTDKSGATTTASELVVIAAAVISGASPTAATTHVFPQFADGQLGSTYYQTTLMISNPSASAAVNCTLQLHGLTVPGFALTYSMPASGWVIASTSGTQAFQSGYATLQCATKVEAQLIYSLFGSDGTKLSEATVFSSPPAANLNVVADQREGSQLGLAIANDSAQSVTYTVAVPGTPQTATVTLLPQTSVAKFINELIPQTPANTLVSVHVTSSTGTGSVIGLRFTGNAFTTIPASTTGVADATAGAYHVFPQFADGSFGDGSYFRSTRIYSNPSTTAAATCTLQLRGMTSDGSGTFPATLSPATSAATPTNGTQALQTGYATAECTSAVDAAVLYSFYSAAGVKLSEATVFSSPPSTTVQILADDRNGSSVGLAIANDSDQSNTYAIAAYDVSGKQVGTATQTLAARSSIAKFITEFMTLPANFYGPVIVTSNSGTASIIGLRFTGNVFTTIPQIVR